MFLPVFLYNTTGFYFHFRWKALELKQTVQHRFSAEDLVTLEDIPADQLVFVDEGKECIYNGAMYDIVELTRSKDTYTIVAYLDKHETDILKKLNEQVDNNTPTGNADMPVGNSKIKFEIKVFISPCQYLTGAQIPVSICEFQVASGGLLPGFQAVDFPPPRRHC